MLSLTGVDVFIQASQILRGVSLDVGAREVVCLVGRNGSGKTTTLRTVMGYLRPRAGAVEFRGRPIHGRRTHEIAMLGLGWAPEDSGIFSDLTVAENIEIATWTRPGGRPAAARIEQAYDVFPALRRYAARKGPEMSGGERKMLSIARALALDPEMLLLDERTSGVSTADKTKIMEILVAAAKRIGLQAIIQVEHDMDIVFAYSHRIIALHQGQILADAPPATILADRRVMDTIIGRDTARPRAPAC